MIPVLPPVTSTAPVRTVVTAIEHSGHPWPPRYPHVQLVAARQVHVAAIDFYPATPTNHQPEA